MTDPPRVLISIATYSELENPPQFVAEIRQQLPDAEILARACRGASACCDILL